MKELALELGQTPSYTLFRKHVKNCQFHLENLKFSYSDCVRESGLVPARLSKVTSKIFEKDIDKHLEEYDQKSPIRSKEYPKILILGDLHFPFINQKALEACYEFSEINNPEYIVQIGDLFDMYSHSKFPRSHNVFLPKEEESKARKMAEVMWSKFKGKKIQICGNHDYRPLKRALETMPTMEHWIEKYLKELLTFDGVETVFDPREEYKISDISFIHGHLNGIGKHRDHFMGNTVVGHSHTAGVSYRQINEKIIWEMNVGYLGDQYSRGLSYTPTKTVPWTLGWGFIDCNGPRFVPF